MFFFIITNMQFVDYLHDLWIIVMFLSAVWTLILKLIHILYGLRVSTYSAYVHYFARIILVMHCCVVVGICQGVLVGCLLVQAQVSVTPGSSTSFNLNLWDFIFL